MSIPLLEAPAHRKVMCEAPADEPCPNEAAVPEHMTMDLDGPLIVPALCAKHTAMTRYLGIFADPPVQ